MLCSIEKYVYMLYIELYNSFVYNNFVSGSNYVNEKLKLLWLLYLLIVIVVKLQFILIKVSVLSANSYYAKNSN